MESNSFIFNSSRFFIGFASVLLVLILVSVLMDAFMPYVDSNDSIGRSISENNEIFKPSDVLFIGDSRTNQGMSPRSFNQALEELNHEHLEAYNLGRPGMQSPFIYLILKNHLKHSGHIPDIVFVNISFYLLHGDNWLNDVYFNYYTPSVEQAMEAYEMNLLSRVGAISWYYRTRIPLLRYRKRILGILEAFTVNSRKLLNDINHIFETFHKKSSPESHDNSGYLSRGFTHIEITDMVEHDYKKDQQKKKYMDALAILFNWAEKTKVHLLIYEFPWPEQRCSKEFKEIISYYQTNLKQIAGRNQYVSFIDYDYCWPYELFVDPLHLNQTGAEVLSSKAAKWYMQR